jgi:hypothetical protein
MAQVVFRISGSGIFMMSAETTVSSASLPDPTYVLYHDQEKIVIRNYEGKIFEYPESGNENVQFAPQREYHDEYLYS